MLQEGVGDGYWVAMGEYCPQMEINGITDNLEYIERHFDEELARQKSAEIFKLLLLSTRKLRGKVRYRKNSLYEKEGKARCLNSLSSVYDWIYCKDGKMSSPSKMSKYDLDTSVYGELHPSKEKYEVLGFIETSEDNKADAFELVDALDKRDKKLLLKQLARELGMQVGEATEETYDEDDEAVFDPGNWVSSEFPIHKVRNKDSLIQHVREQFFCADPVKYMPVLRWIRVSKSTRMIRSYVIGMYTNESNDHICQICKEPAQFVEVVEIANFGLELPQMHLCLCENCASKYKSIRDNRKDDYKVSGDALKKAQNRETELQKKNEELEKVLVIWNNAQNAVDTFETIDMAIAYFDEKKVLKSGNAAIEYLAKYRRVKRNIFEQNSIKEKLQQEIEKEQSELSTKDLILTQDEYKKVIELKNKYQKDITLQVFNVLFNCVIADKLLELDMKRSDKIYRYELYARVIFARMLWDKTVGEDELICVDEGQDVSYYECYIL